MPGSFGCLAGGQEGVGQGVPVLGCPGHGLGVSWVGNSQGHANRVAGDGKGMGRVNQGGICNNAALMELLDVWQSFGYRQGPGDYRA